MASEEAGYVIDDKEWAKVSQQAKWIKCTNERNMPPALAAQRATKIFEILSKGPHQQALDYMAFTIIQRVRNAVDTAVARSRTRRSSSDILLDSGTV